MADEEKNEETKENENEGKKKRKHHPVLITLLVLFLVLVVTPLALIYGFFFDPVRHEDKGIEKTFNEVMETSLYSSLRTVKDDGKMKIDITQDDLNAVFKKAYNMMDPAAKSFIDGVYVDIDNNNYTFYIDAKAPLFMTRLVIRTSLTDEPNVEEPQKGRFIFKIEEIRLGRLNSVASIAKSVAGSSTAEIEAQLAKNGLHITVDLANNSLIYTRENLQKDITAFLGAQQNVMTAVTEQFVADELLTIGSEDPHSLGFVGNLKPFNTNGAYVDPNNDIGLDMTSYGAKMSTLFKGGINITNHENEVFRYLLHGYDDMTNETKTFIDGLDLSSIGINNVSAYEGDPKLQGNPNLSDTVEAQINPAEIVANGKIADLKESDINAFLATSKAIGNGLILKDKNNESIFVVVDNINCNILDNLLYVIVGININGYETRIILDGQFKSIEGYVMNLELRGIYYGMKQIQPELKQILDGYLTSTFQEQNMIGYSLANSTMRLDFSSAIEGSGQSALIESLGGADASLLGNSLTDANARIALTVKE